MRDKLLDFVLALDAATSDEAVERDWGRAFLSPSLPTVWDASGIVIERVGMNATEVLAAADEALASFAHRTIVIRDEEEGARLAREAETAPGWEVEIDLFMTWQEDSGRFPACEVRETTLGECESLRRELIRTNLPPDSGDVGETTEQLLEMNRRYAAAGDRWFVAPLEQPVSACRLLAGGDVGQIEDVGTLPSGRGRGLAQAVVLTALAASRAAGHRTTFLVADAGDWPRLMYEKLGFAPAGAVHVLRRAPTVGITA